MKKKIFLLVSIVAAMLFLSACMAPDTSLIPTEPGPIMRPLIWLFSGIMDGVMWVVANIRVPGSVGVSIIVMTLFIRMLMLPQSMSMIRSQKRMRAVAPDVEKIKKKYGNPGARTPEGAKMNAEIQELYRKNKINPLGSCLQLLITMPIFIALIDLMRRLPWFITRVRDVYIEISEFLINIPNMIFVSGETISLYGDSVIATENSVFFDMLYRRTNPNIVSNFAQRNNGAQIYTRDPEHLLRFIDTFTDSDWTIIKEQVYTLTKDAHIGEMLGDEISAAVEAALRSYAGQATYVGEAISTDALTDILADITARITEAVGVVEAEIVYEILSERLPELLSDTVSYAVSTLPDFGTAVADNLIEITRNAAAAVIEANPEVYYAASNAGQEALASLNILLGQRDAFQHFLGLNLVRSVSEMGLASPAIIIPILAGGTSFLLSWITTKLNPATDPNARMSRMMMLVFMPIMMTIFTFNISGGVGLYWIAGNVIAILQQVLLTKYWANREQKDKKKPIIEG